MLTPLHEPVLLLLPHFPSIANGGLGSRPAEMGMSETRAGVRTCLSGRLLLATQRGAIVGELKSMVWNLCRFLHLIDGQAFLNQFFRLLRLSVVVKIDCSTGHCIATHGLCVWDDSVLALLLVPIPAFRPLSMNNLHQSELGDECHTWWRHLHDEVALRGLPSWHS